MYTWAVIQDCRLVGYVKAHSEWDAVRRANTKYGERLFVERVYLGDCVADNQEVKNESV